MRYSVKIDNTDWTNYIALPFDMNKKNDSTLLTGSLNIVGTDKSDKFYQYSEVEIIIDDTEVNNFIVASDSVTAVRDATRPGKFKYNHGVQIIDRFKLCETYNLPSFSISRHDAEYVPLISNVTITKNEVPDTGTFPSAYSYPIKTDNNIEFYPFSSKLVLGQLPATLKTTYGQNETVNNNNYVTIQAISLPKINFQRLIKYKESWMGIFHPYKKEWIDYEIQDYLYKMTITGTYKHKGSNTTETHNYSKLFPKSGEITLSLFDGVSLPSNVETGIFNIKFSFDPDIDALARLVSEVSNNTGNYNNGNDSKISYYEAFTKIQSLVSEMKANNYYKTDIELAPIQVTSANLSEPKLNYSGVDACEKAFRLVHPIDTSSSDTPIFSLDKTKPSYNILQTLSMPEIVFEKNTLAEVLKSIGRLISGIPKLTADNKVYYDILTEVIDNPDHQDNTNIPYEISSSIENYATTIVSDVSNLIPSYTERNYSYWPAKGAWGKYLSVDQTPWLCPDNAAIRIDNAKDGGIYRLIEFNIRGWNPNNRSQIAHLIQRDENGIETFTRIVTKELWNAYSKDINGVLNPDGITYDNSKSQLRNLYYSPKDFKIVLNELTEAQRIEFSGSNSTWWTYQQAIADAVNNEYGSNTIPNPETFSWRPLIEMEFQVVYIPIINTKYIAERSNFYNTKKSIQTIYSQEDNNPNDTSFGSVTENYLKRLGNDDIVKNEYITEFRTMPYIGENINFEGDTYYCDNLEMTCTTNHITTRQTYTKDYNKLNNMSANPKEYVQYDIPLQESVRRVTNINDYIYIVPSDIESISFEHYTSKPDTDIMRRLRNGLLANSLPVLSPLIGMYKSSFLNEKVLMPIKKFYSDNSIKFQIDAYDNYAITSKVGSLKNGDKYYENFVRYVDALGEVDTCQVCMLYGNNINGVANNIPTNITNMYPVVTGSNPSFTNSSYVSMPKTLKIQKDKKEALSFVFNIHALTNIPSLDICRGFTKCIFNELDDIEPGASSQTPKLYFYNVSSNSTNKDYVSDVDILFTTFSNPRRSMLKISTGFITPTNSYDGWVIMKGKTEILRREEKITSKKPWELSLNVFVESEKIITT